MSGEGGGGGVGERGGIAGEGWSDWGWGGWCRFLRRRLQMVGRSDVELLQV